MTTLGGIGHTLPYLVPDSVAQRLLDRHRHRRLVVLIELWIIAWIRAKYMDTPFLQAAFQIVVGGVHRADGRDHHRRGVVGLSYEWSRLPSPRMRGRRWPRVAGSDEGLHKSYMPARSARPSWLAPPAILSRARGRGTHLTPASCR